MRGDESFHHYGETNPDRWLWMAGCRKGQLEELNDQKRHQRLAKWSRETKTRRLLQQLMVSETKTMLSTRNLTSSNNKNNKAVLQVGRSLATTSWSHSTQNCSEIKTKFPVPNVHRSWVLQVADFTHAGVHLIKSMQIGHSHRSTAQMRRGATLVSTSQLSYLCRCRLRSQVRWITLKSVCKT